MLSTADWRIILTDVRNADGSPLATDGVKLAVTFRPLIGSSLGDPIAECSTDNGLIRVLPADGKGPTILVISKASARSWRATQSMTIVGDPMVYSGDASDNLPRLQFVVTPGTT